MEKQYVIDGNNFSNYEGFIKEFNEKVFGSDYWRGNLDAFSDMLNGGYGTPDQDENFIIVWKNSHKSNKDLGYKATLEWLESDFSRVNPANSDIWNLKIEFAKKNEGETLFYMIIDIILGHLNIELRLIN